MGQTGASGRGLRPSCQPQAEMRLITAGSRAMIVMGTSWLAPVPVTTVAGWWSPSTTSTRSLLSWQFSTKETRVLSEYSMDCAYAARTCSGSRQTTCGEGPRPCP